MGIIGYAICDLDNRHRRVEQSLKQLPSDAIEVQRETALWDTELLKKLIQGYRFVSVHAPTRHVDLSSPDEQLRRASQQKTVDSMNLAHALDADVFVLHPVHPVDYEGWMEPHQRNRRRQTFAESFQSVLVPHYLEHLHSYTIAIENIEYSKYPATLEETTELSFALSAIHPVGIVLDIPHIWNSRRILAENNRLKDSVFGYPWTPDVLHDYVVKFIRHNRERIALYHVANFGENPVRTHDPMTPETIRPELRALIPHLTGAPMILEIYDRDAHALRESKRTLEELADAQY